MPVTGRPPRTDGKLSVSIHANHGYRYASSQPFIIDAETGKKKYRRVHWGTIDDNMKFIPGARYIYASPEEKASLLFPAEWDMSELGKLPENRKPGRPAYDGDDMNRLYGDIWLLEQVADKTGIRQDLEKVFGNKGTVDDIMTLAMFPYLTNFSFNRVARWQAVAKSPSDRELSPPDITRLTQSITEKHRMELLRLRAARLGKHELCAVDSTTRSAYGGSLADIKWGKSKDRVPLEQTTEVVVYTLDSHMPVYYRTFPGNMLDSRSLETILLDLDHAGFKDVVLITDRGYEKIRNLEKYILQGQAMVMCTKVQQKHARDRILAFGKFDTRPDDMEIDQDMRLYYQQYDMEYGVKSTGGSVKKSDRLKLSLYFDVVRRGEELMSLEIDIKRQREQLEALLQEKAVLDDDKTLARVYNYFKVSYEPTGRTIKSYALDEKKVDKAKQTSGFFAITTHRLDMAAMDVLQAYRLRDEQEKYFQQMKSQMGGSRQRNWSEEGKTGRLLIQFVSLILGSYTRQIWRTTGLKRMFSSSLEVLDEMRSIRCIEHTGKAKFITPFVGGQLDICDAFGFKVPEGCSPDYASRQKSAKRRGRPRKNFVEWDY
jgi:transposase